MILRTLGEEMKIINSRDPKQMDDEKVSDASWHEVWDFFGILFYGFCVFLFVVGMRYPGYAKKYFKKNFAGLDYFLTNIDDLFQEYWISLFLFIIASITCVYFFKKIFRFFCFSSRFVILLSKALEKYVNNRGL